MELLNKLPAFKLEHDVADKIEDTQKAYCKENNAQAFSRNVAADQAKARYTFRTPGRVFGYMGSQILDKCVKGIKVFSTLGATLIGGLTFGFTLNPIAAAYGALAGALAGVFDGIALGGLYGLCKSALYLAFTSPDQRIVRKAKHARSQLESFEHKLDKYGYSSSTEKADKQKVELKRLQEEFITWAELAKDIVEKRKAYIPADALMA